MKFHKKMKYGALCLILLLAFSFSNGLAEEQGINLHKIEVLVNGLKRPVGLALDQNGNILCTVHDKEGYGEIKRISSDGSVETLINKGLLFPGAMEISKDGAIVTINYSTGELYYINPITKEISTYQYFEGTAPKVDPIYTEPIIAYSLTLDRTDNTLFTLGEYPQGNKIKIDPWLLCITNDLNNGKQSFQQNKMYVKDYNSKLKNPIVTATVKKGLFLYVAVEGKGIFVTSLVYRQVGLIEGNEQIFEKKQVLGMVLDSKDNLYIATCEKFFNGVIYCQNNDTGAITVVAKGLRAPTGMVIKNGYLYVADFEAGTICKITLDNQ